ncbi:hypothetical protein DPMN_035240 [Dreissena polymorpha]|uniref:Uncharacterized protein n=1 Tax=Dreissena polymorpha TaxID=45954 RepID=A0A9D4RMQ5_DREPO|nr:hypothetical protein DPMN_035240 [Dreissena polymorpha]
MTMSNAASTIPGKPNLYHNNKSKSKEDVKNLQNGKAAQNNPTDVNKEEINPKLVHKTKQHGANGKNTTPKVNANGKSWMEKNSSKLSNEAKPSKNMKPDFRWMPKPLASDPNQIKILSIPEYQAMTKEIETLRERCFNDGGKISELEKQQSKLLGEFDALYEENAMLRKKLDTGNEPIAEPYGRVFEDRKILRESELGYKKRINRLEQEHKEARKEVEKLTNELKAIRAKQSGKAETPGKESIIYHLNTQIQKLRNDNQKLSAQVKKYSRTTQTAIKLKLTH